MYVRSRARMQRKINVSCGLRVALRNKCKGYHSSITATALAGSQYQTKQMTRCRPSLSDSLSATRNPQLTLIFSYHVLWKSATRNPQLTLIFLVHASACAYIIYK